VLLRWRHKAAVSGRIGKDLDAIVLKALKKEPDQRYASATELMDDIQRYLRGFPIAARDDSTRYRLTKFVTRNRVGVGIAALALLSLIAGLIGTTLQAGIAGRERDARRLEAERARTVADFAVGLFDMVDPTRAQGATVTVQDLVAAGVRRISELASQPTQQAMFMDVMGRVSAAAGQFQKADSLFREAVAIKIGQLGEGDPGVAESLLGLGESLLMQNRLVEAETVLDRAQRIQIAAFGSTDPRNLKYQNQLGFAYFTLGDRDHAERLLRGVLARGAEPELREHTEIVEAQYNLWRVLDYYGEYAQAEPYLRDMLRRRESEYGTDHSETAHIAFTLARNLANQEKLEESTALYQRARDTYERVYGAEGVYTIHAIYGLAQVQHRRGALREAEQGYRTAARIYATQPSSGIWQAYARVSLGQVLVLLEKPAEAEREILQGLEIYLAAQTVDTEQVAIARSWLGRALTDLARHAEAESLLLLAHDSLAKRPDRTRQNQDALRHLVQLYRTWNRPEDAIRYEQLLSEAQSKTSH
jgi:serine/threonine-protein kinase